MYGVAKEAAVLKGVRSIGQTSGYALTPGELRTVYQSEGFRMVDSRTGEPRNQTLQDHVSTWIHSGRVVRIGDVIFFKLEEDEYRALARELDAYDQANGTKNVGYWSPFIETNNEAFDIYTVKHEDGTVEYVRNAPKIRGLFRCCPLNPCTPLPRTPRGNADTR